MPLYEYLCPKCGRFELIRKFSDEAVTKCRTCHRPHCGECLVFPRGPKGSALCIPCALAVAGVRERRHTSLHRSR